MLFNPKILFLRVNIFYQSIYKLNSFLEKFVAYWIFLKCFNGTQISFDNILQVYIEKLLQPLPCDKRFQFMASIFKWWCRMVSLYQCNPELPSLLLARLCSSLEELIASGSLKLSMQKTENNKCARKQSDLNGMKEIRASNGMKENVMDKTKNISGEEHGHHIECKDNQKDSEGNDIGKLLSFQNRIKLSNGYKGEEFDEETGEEVKDDSSLLLADRKETSALEDFACKEKKEMFIDRFLENDCKENSHMNIVKRSNDTDNCTNKMKKGMVKPEMAEITSTDFKREIEDLIFSVVKYVPASNLVASIASKLKKLYEI